MYTNLFFFLLFFSSNFYVFFFSHSSISSFKLWHSFITTSTIYMHTLYAVSLHLITNNWHFFSSNIIIQSVTYQNQIYAPLAWYIFQNECILKLEHSTNLCKRHMNTTQATNLVSYTSKQHFFFKIFDENDTRRYIQSLSNAQTRKIVFPNQLLNLKAMMHITEKYKMSLFIYQTFIVALLVPLLVVYPVFFSLEKILTCFCSF